MTAKQWLIESVRFAAMVAALAAWAVFMVLASAITI